jgi:hypothetical protein
VWRAIVLRAIPFLSVLHTEEVKKVGVFSGIIIINRGDYVEKRQA